MTTISNKIDDIYLLPSTEKTLFLSGFERIEVRKGTIVISAEKIERFVYFIEKGLARAYRETDKGQRTIWFGEAGGVILSFLSFFKNQPGYESIEILEDSVLYRMSSSHLQELYHLHLPIANWGRKFAELELLLTEQRFMDLQFRTATERYEDLIKHSPTILQRVQLGHIASYLGITQVSLSRIRATAKS